MKKKQNHKEIVMNNSMNRIKQSIVTEKEKPILQCLYDQNYYNTEIKKRIKEIKKRNLTYDQLMNELSRIQIHNEILSVFYNVVEQDVKFLADCLNNQYSKVEEGSKKRNEFKVNKKNELIKLIKKQVISFHKKNNVLPNQSEFNSIVKDLGIYRGESTLKKWRSQINKELQDIT